MSTILGAIGVFVGYVGLATATFIWVIHFLYELIAKNADFWSSAFTNLGMWVLQMVVSVIVLGVGYVLAGGK